MLLLFLGAISPKTFNAADVPFQPVPWALGSYFCLTLVRLVWAQFYRFPGGRWPFDFFDMALLMVVIWVSHAVRHPPHSI